MSDLRGPPDPPDWSDSDQRWFDALTGVSAETTHRDAPEVQQATSLRQSIKDEEATILKSDALKEVLKDEHAHAELQALKARLRERGQLPTPLVPAAKTPWWLAGQAKPGAMALPRWGIPTALVLGTLAAFVVIPRLTDKPDYDAPPYAMRSDVPVIKRGESTPKQAAEALVNRLKAGGARAQIYQVKKTYIVMVTVLQKDLPEVATVLEKEGLPPQVGDYRVEYTAP